MLIAGDPGSGKSWMSGLICEQLILQPYSVCVIDPEGDYAPLESLPGVLVLGQEGPPSLRDVERALRFPEVSVVVDLSTMPLEQRLEYVPSLLQLLAAVRRERGLPHRTGRAPARSEEAPRGSDGGQGVVQRPRPEIRVRDESAGVFSVDLRSRDRQREDVEEDAMYQPQS